MELTTNEVGQLQLLFKEYAEENYLTCEHENQYTFEVYTDYHTEHYISDVVKEKSDQTIDDIDEYLQENFYSTYEIEHIQYYFDEFVRAYHEKIEQIKEGLTTEFKYNNSEDFEIYLNAYIDYRSIIEITKVDVNIVLENDESFDTEFSNNSFFNLFNYYDLNDSDELNELIEILKESSLSTLLYKQGYTLNQFINYIKTDESSSLDNDKVFQSILNEVNNAQNYQALTVCRSMTFKEYEDLKKSKQITINKNDVIGYLGYVDGSGSLFEIKLNNDMVFDTNDINIHIDNTFGYGLIEVYGSYMIA